jgi:hypothetical protein
VMRRASSGTGRPSRILSGPPSAAYRSSWRTSGWPGPVGAGADAFPAPEGLGEAEGLREAGDLQISQPSGHLRDRKSAGDQEFLGELLASFIQQAAEGHTFAGEPPAQRPVAHVQLGGDLTEGCR